MPSECWKSPGFDRPLPLPTITFLCFIIILIIIHSTCDAPSDVTEHPISLSDHVAPLSVTVKSVRLAIVTLTLVLRCVLKLSMEDLWYAPWEPQWGGAGRHCQRQEDLQSLLCTCPWSCRQTRRTCRSTCRPPGGRWSSSLTLILLWRVWYIYWARLYWYQNATNTLVTGSWRLRRASPGSLL